MIKYEYKKYSIVIYDYENKESYIEIPLSLEDNVHKQQVEKQLSFLYSLIGYYERYEPFHIGGLCPVQKMVIFTHFEHFPADDLHVNRFYFKFFKEQGEPIWHTDI